MRVNNAKYDLEWQKVIRSEQSERVIFYDEKSWRVNSTKHVLEWQKMIMSEQSERVIFATRGRNECLHEHRR